MRWRQPVGSWSCGGGWSRGDEDGAAEQLREQEAIKLQAAEQEQLQPAMDGGASE